MLNLKKSCLPFNYKEMKEHNHTKEINYFPKEGQHLRDSNIPPFGYNINNLGTGLRNICGSVLQNISSMSEYILNTSSDCGEADGVHFAYTPPHSQLNMHHNNCLYTPQHFAKFYPNSGLPYHDLHYSSINGQRNNFMSQNSSFYLPSVIGFQPDYNSQNYEPLSSSNQYCFIRPDHQVNSFEPLFNKYTLNPEAKEYIPKSYKQSTCKIDNIDISKNNDIKSKEKSYNVPEEESFIEQSKLKTVVAEVNNVDKVNTVIPESSITKNKIFSSCEDRNKMNISNPIDKALTCSPDEPILPISTINTEEQITYPQSNLSPEIHLSSHLTKTINQEYVCDSVDSGNDCDPCENDSNISSPRLSSLSPIPCADAKGIWFLVVDSESSYGSSSLDFDSDSHETDSVTTERTISISEEDDDLIIAFNDGFGTAACENSTDDSEYDDEIFNLELGFRFDNEGHAYSAAELKLINSEWDEQVLKNSKKSTPCKVNFNDSPQVWEIWPCDNQLNADAERFRRRINNFEPVINRVLCPSHRKLMYEKIYGDSL